MMWWNQGPSLLSMWLVMAIAFGGLALLIVLAVRTEFAPRTRQPADPRVTDAREVLALRLARGDIDATEYLDRINALADAHHA
ncbi:MAG: hypothetical protein ACJ71Z_12785 [Aeromicrobium sp.]